MSRGAGITEEQLRDLADFRTSDAFSPVQKLVLEYAEQMTRTPVEVADDLFDGLRRQFDDGQLVELTAVIALENYRARFNHSLGVEAQGYSRGAYCPLPQRE